MYIYPLSPLVLLLLSWYLSSWHVILLHSFLHPAHIEFEALKSAGRYAMYIQWSNDHRSLFSFEHLKETLGKYLYIPGTPNNQFFLVVSIANHYIKNGCFTKHPLKNGCLGYQVYIYIYEYIRFSVRGCVCHPAVCFFFVGCSQDRRKEGSSLGKGQVSFHGVWPKQNSECKNRRSQTWFI